MNHIQNILNEIYAVDPELKSYEGELIRIIEEIINKRPDTQFDEAFAKELRTEVLKRAHELKMAKSEPEAMSFFATLPKWTFAAAGLVLLLAAVLPLSLSHRQNNSRIALDTGVTKLAGNAFGPLNMGTGERMSSPSTLGMGGGSEKMALESNDGVASFGLGAGEDMVVDRAMIMPGFRSYRFEYAGDDLSLDQASELVYRRPQNSGSAERLASLLGGLDLGLINIGALGNLSVDSMSLSQDKEYGLVLNFNAREGFFSLYQNWQRWPQINAGCETEACYEQNRLRIEEVPADSVVIGIANDFLRGMGVDTGNYGSPEVSNSWRQIYDRAEDKSQAWVPEELQVIYPLQLGGQAALEYGGTPHGLTVNVNVRAKRTAGLYNLYPYNYESSAYPMTSDFGRIVKLAEGGGEYPVHYYEGGDMLTLRLGTPEKVLMQYHQYDNAKGVSNALYVPALRFPILNREEAQGYYWQDYVMIPLVEDIVSEWEGRHKDADGQPMPLPRPIDTMPITIMDEEITDSVSDEGSAGGTIFDEGDLNGAVIDLPSDGEGNEPSMGIMPYTGDL